MHGVAEDKGEFWDRQGGWRMFLPEYQTDAIRYYRKTESEIIFKWLNSNRSVRYIAEGGCGFGTYLEEACRHGVQYSGFDTVQWMINEAKSRRPVGVRQFSSAELHLGRIEFEGANHLSSLPCNQALTLLPFNLIGNIDDTHVALKSLASTNQFLAVSTFNDTEYATSERIKFYEKCGFKTLQVNKNPRGVLITSDEGLKSWAFSQACLGEFCAAANFELLQTDQIGEIGHLTIYRSVVDNTDRRDKGAGHLGMQTRAALQSVPNIASN